MIEDARSVDADLEADVCIVGAGPAGISLALELLRDGVRVVLLEGGGLELETEAQDLYRGTQVGIPTDSLHVNRLRVFGGTTGHWGGWCRPLDPIDFAVRDWVPHSGWPFGLEELTPYYTRAYGILGVEDPDRDDAEWMSLVDGDAPRLDGPILRNTVFRFSRPPVRFGDRYRTQLAEHDRVTLLLHANAVEVECDASARSVEAVRVATLEGGEFRVRARHTVLATGAVENARLLLASDSVQKRGLGNDRDLVGRYFLQHPHVLESQLVCVGGAAAQIGRDTARDDVGIVTAITPEVMREYRLLNYHVLLWRVRNIRHDGLIGTAREVFDQLRNVYGERDLERDVAYYLETLARAKPEARDGMSATTIAERPEQAPNPDSRITLGSERDALGMRRVVMNWQLTELDRHTFRTARELVAQEVGRLGIGRLRDWRPGFDPTGPASKRLKGGNHHLGTTRMHDDPAQGVVDRNCRVHGIENLHVAGSSVFPTTGYANPTLTIIALAVRLSGTLRESLRRI